MLVDSHCHLDLEHFDEDRVQAVQHANDCGVNIIINPGIDLQHSRQAIALAEQFEGVYAAVGVHPNSSGNVGRKTIDALRDIASHPKVVAIGEIGLDYYWDKVEPNRQKEAFQAQLDLAADVGLPVIIHSRESNDDVAEILDRWSKSAAVAQSTLSKRPYKGVLHAYSGDIDLVQRAYSWGFVLSLGGPVTFKNAKDLHQLVPLLQIDRLMLETDAPFLTPHPHRGERNEPAYIPLICQKLAQLFETTSEQVAATTTQVALDFFNIESVSSKV